MTLTEADYYRGGIANAIAEDLTLQEVWALIEHAHNGKDFDTAVNLYVNMKPEADNGHSRNRIRLTSR